MFKSTAGVFLLFGFIFQKLFGLGPVFNSPVFKIPFLHIGITFVIDLIQFSVIWDKICREIVDIQVRRI